MSYGVGTSTRLMERIGISFISNGRAGSQSLSVILEDNKRQVPLRLLAAIVKDKSRVCNLK